MTSLKALQDSFQRGILAGDNAILGAVNDSASEARGVLFGVYRNAYVARLAEILAEDYEQLHAYLGDAAFARLVKDYIAAHPSDRRSARWFGRHLPAFVATGDRNADHPEVAEIASLEKALEDAFDAPDAEPLALADLAVLTPDAWPELILKPHPTAIPLSFATNACEIWSALHDGAPPPRACSAAEPQAVLVWRQDFTSRFRTLPPEEAMMWFEAAKDVPFGRLCELVAIHGGADDAGLRAATYLKTWVELGLLAR